MHSDVIILGGGLVGLTFGLALDAHGLSATIVDPADPEAVLAPGFDGRASAIASASWAMLQAIGLGDRLDGKGCPIRAIRVSDGLKPGALDFVPAADEDALGIMFGNRLLRQTLHAAAAEAKQLQLLMPARAATTERGPHGVTVTLEDGRVLRAPLLIAAEGRNSPTRRAAGINVARWNYDHVGIIAAIEHDRPHDNVAYEIFYPEGPFAILPLLPGNRSGLVWSVARADAPGYLKLGERGFLAELERKMDGLLGSMKLLAPLSAYPLGFHHAGRITDHRLALVGDAAHGIHPIAGQGLNLGLRDAAALTEVLVEGTRLGLDLGDAQLMKRYERWRSLDTFLVASSTDSLARLFGIRGEAASAVRRFGLSAVQRIKPLKEFFMAEARGEFGDKPKLLSGLTV
ncbi:UbiH/UbiF/VisC/COQ6 family ubiquinone biosynthesis hydroxylase [Sphingomonas sp.]|uniref:UbiH/UbiF/VisC/COQ6 family ubiquinone biosynthesis hydroxylase n=1 Tax=Sphingomonas sp. TaxID=28214 RepID=UPI002DE29CED|nr:UbiH/UbiF/VisC/COQ6 family ubiquinone biosynthesis hydroxylase [Sphingomonas sp.]